MIVTCNGCFDGIHPGHLFFLGYCRGQGDSLIVGINSDSYIEKYKRQKVFYSQKVRIKALMSLGFIDKVVLFEEDTPNEFIKTLNPDIHCTGEENTINCPEAKTCQELNIELQLVPRIKTFSTTNMDDSTKDYVNYFMKRRMMIKL